MADVETLLREYGRQVDRDSRAVTTSLVAERAAGTAPSNGSGPKSHHSARRWRGGLLAVAASVLAVVGFVAFVNGDGAPDTVTIDPVEDPPPVEPVPVPSTSEPGDDTAPVAEETGPVAPAQTPARDGRATAGTPAADLAGAVAADDGAPPLPLGTVTELPNPDRLDFLFEHCFDGCWRDAHFIDPDDPRFGSGPWVADRPFHIRHGFVNDGPEPLGEGYDVAVYAYPMDAPHEAEGVALGETRRYSSDFVLRGEDARCGPGYRDQTGPVTCEWFVHDFPSGLPAGRWAIWAVWQAPCTAWIDLGFVENCSDPDEVMSLFSSGVDSPFDATGGQRADYSEADATRMALGDYLAFYGRVDRGPPQLEIDVSGAAATAGTPEPDAATAVAGDDGAARLPLGAVAGPAFESRLDFLFERCAGEEICWRDAVFRHPDDPTLTSAAGSGGEPFYVAHGFVNDGPEPLSDDFDVVVYEFEMDAPHEAGAEANGAARRYTSDYALRVETDRCGPNYRNQAGPVTCEWFVHEFADGLAVGRHALWAVWEAPCSAWIDLGFVAECADPDEVVSHFASGVDSPWEPWPIIWDQT